MQADLNKIKTGGVEDFSNFVNAVIDEASFDKLAKAIDDAQASPDAEVILGGKYDKSKGYFIYPTVIQAKKPDYITMREELFGPVLTIYVYEPDQIEETLDLLDAGSAYALTGAIFSNDEQRQPAHLQPAEQHFLCRQQFLHQRQTYRSCRRPATFRRRPGFRNQR